MKLVIRTMLAYVVIMYSIATVTVAASKWDVIDEKDLVKPWTVTFSEEVDVESIPVDAISIQNEQQTALPITVTQQGSHELVVPLVNDTQYEPNHTYALSIAPFASAAGHMLVEAVTMTFKTADAFSVNPEFLPKISATPVNAYNNQALVTLSYDDGYENWYTKALPLHAKYNMSGMFNINTYHFEEGTPGFMTSGQVWVAADRGIEIGAHTHDHMRLTALDEVKIREQLQMNIDALKDWAGVEAHTLAAPNSAYNDDVRNIAKEYFDGIRVYGSQLNDTDNYDPYWLKSHAVTNMTTLDEMKGWIDEAVATNSWLIITLHNVVDEPIAGCANGAEECDELYDISTANLEALMAYIRSFDEQQLLPVSTYEGIQMTSHWAQ